MIDAAVSEFPFVQELPKRKRSVIAEVWATIGRMQRMNVEEGGLLPVMVAARALNLSRSRVDDLVRAGRLRRFEVEGHVFISGRSVAEFAYEERRVGRPRLQPVGEIVLDIARTVGSKNP